MVHWVAHRERGLLVGAIDRGRTGIDQMLKAGKGARQFQHHHLAHDIGGDIGVWIDQRVAHAGLGCEMHDAGDAGEVGGQLQHAVTVCDIDLVEIERLVGRQLRQPRLFQPHIIVVVEIVDADHGIAARQQGLGHGRADEAGRACHQDDAAAAGPARPTLI